MKNLKILLALLAALALVFAAGCSSEVDDPQTGGNNNAEQDSGNDDITNDGGTTDSNSGDSGEQDSDNEDSGITDYSGEMYNLTIDGGAIWLDGAERHPLSTQDSTFFYLGMVTLDFAESGDGVDVIVDYASCTLTGGGRADTHTKTGTAPWLDYGSGDVSNAGDIHYQATISGASYNKTSSGIAVLLPATTGDAANSALTLYFEAGKDSTTGDATLTLTSTSETASYNVLGTESTTDALGNTVYDAVTGGQPTGYDTAKDIFSNATFNGNDTVLAQGSVFTKQ